MSKIIIDTDALPYWLTSNTKYLSWWLDLLMHGERVDSIRNLSKRWTQDKRSPAISVVQNYLKKLRRENLLAEQNPNRTRTEPERVIICSYDSYIHLANRTRTEPEHNPNKLPDTPQPAPNPSEIYTRAQDSIYITHSSNPDSMNQSCIESRSEEYNFNNKSTAPHPAGAYTHTHEEGQRREPDLRGVLDYFNAATATPGCKMKRVETVGGNRIALLRQRMEQYGDDKVRQVIDKAVRSPFLNGRGSTGWVADLGWIMNEDNFPKIADGIYDELNHKQYDYSDTRLARQEAEERARYEHYAKHLAAKLSGDGGLSPAVSVQGDDQLPF